MKYLKESAEFYINRSCKKYDIKNYSINKNGKVDIDGNVNLNGHMLTILPFKFGTVTGDFYCSDAHLITLEGCPENIGGNFRCSDNMLTSLEGCPEKLNGYFNCGHNQLESLEGGPNEIRGSYHCNNNRLKTLKGSPKFVNGNFNCRINNLISLVDGPTKINGSLFCSDNPIKSLLGFPEVTEYIHMISASTPDRLNLPKEIMKNFFYIKEILKYQDDYNIWNNDLSLNTYRFNMMIEEIIDNPIKN